MQAVRIYIINSNNCFECNWIKVPIVEGEKIGEYKEKGSEEKYIAKMWELDYVKTHLKQVRDKKTQVREINCFTYCLKKAVFHVTIGKWKGGKISIKLKKDRKPFYSKA